MVDVRDGVAAEVKALRAEMAALQDVAAAILTVHDLAQVLLTVNTRLLRLLGSDIAGVWLLEGDELVMGSASGHWGIELERTRIQAGQGLAGLVLATGNAHKVDDYLASDTISLHFSARAQEEQVRSALAVPLRDRTQVIGVLEVWRRRPSVFSERDVDLMETLANLVAIAITNARLYEHQQRSLDEVAAAQASLQSQVETLRRSGLLQRQLSELVVAGAALTDLAEAAARATGGAVVLAPVGGGDPVVRPAGSGTELPGLTALLRRVADRPESQAGPAVESLTDGRVCWAQRVRTEAGAAGAVVLIREPGSASPDAFLEMACGQTATAVTLHHLEDEAAIRARAEAVDDVLWDLLTGDAHHQAAALSHAQRLRLSLASDYRLVHGAIDPAGDPARLESSRMRIVSEVRAAARELGCEPASVRGNWIVVVSPDELGACRALIDRLSARLAKALGHPPAISWGISSTVPDLAQLARAYDEARTAAAANARVGARRVLAYDELGVVRLLVGESAGDMERFIGEVLGPVLDYDARRAGNLLETLEAYFGQSCSQREAAVELGIHPKTLSYRLQQVRDLTGLDLSRHEDRVRADLALRIHQVRGRH